MTTVLDHALIFIIGSITPRFVLFSFYETCIKSRVDLTYF